jgi:hypothetical protein
MKLGCLKLNFYQVEISFIPFALSSLLEDNTKKRRLKGRSPGVNPPESPFAKGGELLPFLKGE